MATHSIRIDRGDTAYNKGRAVISTITPAVTNPYPSEGYISWDSTTVTTKGKLMEAVDIIKSRVENGDYNESSSSARRGYNYTIGQTENEVTFDTSISDGDVAFEGEIFETGGGQKAQLELIQLLKDSISNLSFPIA